MCVPLTQPDLQEYLVAGLDLNGSQSLGRSAFFQFDRRIWTRPGRELVPHSIADAIDCPDDTDSVQGIGVGQLAGDADGARYGTSPTDRASVRPWIDRQRARRQ